MIVHTWARLALLLLSLSALACNSAKSTTPPDSDPDPDPILTPPTLASVRPPLGDPLGGISITVTGTHLTGATVKIGGELCTSLQLLSETTCTCDTPPLDAGTWDITVTTKEGQAILPDAFEAWSPADIPGARLFDAAAGVETAELVTTYEWQRLTDEIHPDWRVRDGNTTTWFPATNKFWMLGGWNGMRVPDGFSIDDPDITYPPQNTTSEVWSSPNGIEWTLELPHGNTAFERRHVHNAMIFQDRLWMIGGDSHQGYYNHDVVTSANGIDWEVVLGPGTTRPPWSERSLQFSGVFAGKLWTGGGQDTLGLQDDWTYHNDLWSSPDGRNWTQVLSDDPTDTTRWSGRGSLEGLVEFHGRMWLVGGARYRDDGAPVTHFREVWSSADGLTWQQHATPPWVGKSWPCVVVWDDKLWMMFGYTLGDPANGWSAGNSNEVWYSSDGESWTSLPIDSPVPGSHAQGVAVRPDFLLFSGGNHSYGFGAGVDKSVWRLVPFRGTAVQSWTDRGHDALVVAATEPARRPVLIPDGLGEGLPGLQFDGSNMELDLAASEPDAQADGRSVFWLARTPYVGMPWGWDETYAPVGTILGGLDASGYPNSSIGLSEGAVVCVNREAGLGEFGEPLWARVEGGEKLQEGIGAVHFAGITHASDGTMQVWVDGAQVPTTGTGSYATPRSWRRIGGSMEGSYYGPGTRFAGTLGMVLIIPSVVDDLTLHRINVWALGRFGETVGVGE